MQARSFVEYEKLKDKGENVYIDILTYEQFMMLEIGRASCRERVLRLV